MQAILYLFGVKKDVENATYSHLTLGASVKDAISRYNTDLTYLKENCPVDEIGDITAVCDYFASSSLFCLGSLDLVSGELVSNIECHGALKDLLEVLKDES